MVKVDVLADSKFPVNRKAIRERVFEVLEKMEMNGQITVSVLVVGDRKMRSLNKKYRKLNKTTDVLSFPTNDPSQPIDDGGFLQAMDLGVHLGDIVVSYPQAVIIASEKNRLLDEVVGDLVEHGMMHLLGYHHD